MPCRRQDWLIKLARPMLVDLLAKHKGNRTRMAEELGTTRITVIRWLEYCGLKALPPSKLVK